jgi:hypothetical protein
MPLITYADKVQLNNNPDIPDNQKCMAKDMNEIKSAINTGLLNLIYPVGCYFETSDNDFNPNTSWGGTWVLDSAGKVTVAKDEDDTDFDTLGKTGGSKELQQHKHNGLAWLGDFSGQAITLNTGSGGGYALSYSSNINSAQKNYIQTANAGTGDSGNLQPYIVVNRWHRTA